MTGKDACRPLPHMLDLLRCLFDRRFRRICLRCAVQGLPDAKQRMRICGKGKVVFGDRVSFGWKRSPGWNTTEAYIEARNPGSSIEIADGCVFSNGAAIISEGESACGGIRIGRSCVVGAGFRCYDSDFHGLYASAREDRSAVKTSPVFIGDECFIGEGVIVLKGVEIGDRCVIGAGAVVTKSFPPDSVIAGNPAVLLRRLT